MLPARTPEIQQQCRATRARWQAREYVSQVSIGAKAVDLEWTMTVGSKGKGFTFANIQRASYGVCRLVIAGPRFDDGAAHELMAAAP
jgi:hypothetical protein